MDDIEDLAASLPENRGENGLVHPVKVHRAAAGGPQAELARPDAGDNDAEKHAGVPGVGKVWSKTFGCSHNVSDGEYMEGALQAYGYELTSNEEEADVLLVNSCTVKDPSQSAFLNVVKRGQERGKKVVVSGCVPQADRSLKELDNVSMIGIAQIDRVVEVVEQTLAGNTVRLLGKKELPRLDLPKVRKNKLVEIVPLSTGCLGSCTYCKTKHARGKLGSYDIEALVSRVESVVREGKQGAENGKEDDDLNAELYPKEIWLASEDTGAYGIDLGTDIAVLLHRLTAVLERDGGDDTMLRLGMTNPPYILAHLDRLSEALRHKNVFRFLHIPVQSGSNAVLTDMNREYTVEQFCLVVDYMRKHVPGISISTDIICGFPGETEEQFDETLALVEKYKFPHVHISQFYPRPGTPAAKMKRIDTKIVKARSRKLTALFDSYRPYDHLVGETMTAWVGDEVAGAGAQTVAHNQSYVKVCITPRDDRLKGKRVKVKVVAAHKFHVDAVLVQPGEE